jgi:hypothetical protein
MATSGSTHLSFVVLEVFQKIQEPRSPLSGFRLLMLFGKSATTGFFTTRLTKLETLAEKVKLQTFWWLKSYYILFDFDYPFWRLDPLSCLKAVV